MATPDTPASATAADLRALADFTQQHPEYGAEIAHAVQELHVMLHGPFTPTALVGTLVAETGAHPATEPLHADRAYDTEEVTLPGGIITLSVHKLRRGVWPPSTAPQTGPVMFDRPDEATRLRATLANVAVELRALLGAPNHIAYEAARLALTHRLHEIEAQ